MSMKLPGILAFLCCVFLNASASAAKKDPKSAELPYFATLKSQPTNVRVGPGKIYPIEWVLLKAGVPVQVTAKHEHWRKIRDAHGTEGWIHFRMLSNKPTAITLQNNTPLYRNDKHEGDPVAFLNQGVVVKIKKCRDQACLAEHPDVKGWILKTAVWGIQ